MQTQFLIEFFAKLKALGIHTAIDTSGSFAITDDIKKRNVKKEMIDRFSINSISMVDVPCVLVIKDGKLNSIYSVTANNYSVDKFENFIDSVGEIND